MLIRLVILFAIIAALAALGAWLADNPGDITIQWGEWRIDTPAAAGAVALAVLAVLVAVIDRLWRWLRRGPAALGEGLRSGRRKRGYMALTQGLAAVAAGDAREAEKLARKAEDLLDEPALTLLLSAQAAQLGGRGDAAGKSFAAMLEKPETEFLGLRGLLIQAVREGDQVTALRHAKRAFQLRPDTPWVLKTLFDLQAADGDWAGARVTLDHAVRRGVVEKPLGDRRKALLLFAEAQDAGADGNDAKARDLALQSHKLLPDFVPAAALAAKGLMAGGKKRRAAKILLEAWNANPHPDLAQAFIELEAKEQPAQRLRRAAALRNAKPDHLETRVVVAGAALAAGEWDQVRQTLEPAIESGEADARVYRLMADLEKQQHGDSASARDWLLKAANARPSDAWICQSCGRTAEAWTIHCGTCSAFDSLRWGGPAMPAAGSGDAVLMALEADLDPLPVAGPAKPGSAEAS